MVLKKVVGVIHLSEKCITIAELSFMYK